jgi:hypothetical protein
LYTKESVILHAAKDWPFKKNAGIVLKKIIFKKMSFL